MRKCSGKKFFVWFCICTITATAGVANVLAAGEPTEEMLACWKAAGELHHVDPLLLRAIAKVESEFDPAAIGDKGKSIGLHQIHTFWHSILQEKYGVNREHLFDPCTNTFVAAWILGQEMTRYGDTWLAVGAFNAGAIPVNAKADFKNQRLRSYRGYAWKVYEAYRTIRRSAGVELYN